METSGIYKLKFGKKSWNLLQPIIIRYYLGKPIQPKQQANLRKLSQKYGEDEIKRVIDHGLAAMTRKNHVPHPRAANESYYEDSEETLEILPPPEPRPLTEFLSKKNKARVFNNVEKMLDYVFRESNPSTLDSRFDVSRPLTVATSPLASPVREMNEEKTIKPLASPSPNPQREMGKKKITRPAKLSKFKYREDEGRVAPGNDTEESAEGTEKSPQKLIPQQQAFERRLVQSKAMIAGWNEKEKQLQRAEQQIALTRQRRPKLYNVEELLEWATRCPVEEEPVLDKLQPQMVEGSGSEFESERALGRWPVPNDFDNLLDEIMLGIPQELIDMEGAGYNDKKLHVRSLLSRKGVSELRATHKKLFEHHPRDIPLQYARQGFIDNTRLVRANLPEAVQDSDSDNDMGKKEEMKLKVSTTMLAKSQRDRPTPERQRLTNAELKRKKLWGTIDPQRAKELKDERSEGKQKERKKKNTAYQALKRAAKRNLEAGNAPDNGPQQ